MQLNGTFDVKLGKSFLDRDSTSYMTMRCDFMPASVDRSQPGSIKVNKNKEVVVSLPNVTNSGPDTATLFRGTARPVQKECILIYNKKTHELTLERIAHTVQLKKTREERKSDATGPPNSEIPQFQSLAGRSEQDLKSIRPSPTKRKSNDPEMSTSSTIVQQSTQKKPPHSRTLSSSSSSSSNSGTSSSCDMDIETSESDSDSSSESDSNSSTLSSLSNDRNKTSNTKPSSNGKTNIKTVNTTNLAAHRKLIEHDLKLSDSDSDSSA
ncbi:unnamed protein product [Schistosoma rodhaini]|uniref:Transcription elongation factor Eaf N-terminal domain-containing protein n=1 Tax=Schistosoma rodhaini TaxID=6188 RepID=A0AA85ESK2_9TREM|nr:unnamed protein product [Schistosoma rodhaini]CAH8661226.1 unnamed protein product [Schistosoma rodhaini]